MDCHTAQEHILETLDEGDWGADIRAHIAGCEGCARFVSAQIVLDARLSRAIVSPRLRPEFRAALSRKMALERTTWVRDALPDILHFLSWSAATIASAAVLSVDPAFVFATGAAAALSSYVLATLVRSTLEDV